MRLQSVCWVERSSDVPETNLLLITLTTVTAYVLSSGCAWVRPYSATSSLPPCLITVKTGMVKYAECHISTKWWGQGSNPGWVQITNVLVRSLPVQHHPWPGTSTGSTEPWTATWAVTALSHDDDRQESLGFYEQCGRCTAGEGYDLSEEVACQRVVENRPEARAGQLPKRPIRREWAPFQCAWEERGRTHEQFKRENQQDLETG